MLKAGLLFALIGLGAAIGLIAWHGFDDVLRAFSVAGWGILWASLFHLIPLAMASYAWMILFPGRRRPTFAFMAYIMWVRAAVNNLMPVARIGGEVIAARLLIKHGWRKAPAVASVVVETTISVVTVFIFDIAGILLLALHNPTTDIMIKLAAAIAVSLPVIAALLVVQRAGFFGLFARLVKMFAGEKLKQFVGSTARFDRAIRAMYRRHRRIFICSFWMLLSWIVGAGQIWIALYFLGHPLPLLDCLILEAMIQLAGSVAFIVPGALGAQEGAILLFGGMLGLSPETALALALIRRCRDLIIYVPGLIAWQYQEGRWLLKKKTA